MSRSASVGLALFLLVAPLQGAEGQSGSRHRRASSPDTTGYLARHALRSRAGVSIEPFYVAEFISNLQGGIRRGSALHGVADLAVTADPIPLVGWDGARLGLSAVGIHGKEPGTLVGDHQGVSGIAAPATLRLYGLWLIPDRSSRTSGVLKG